MLPLDPRSLKPFFIPLKKHAECVYDPGYRGNGLMLKCLNVLQKLPVHTLLCA